MERFVEIVIKYYYAYGIVCRYTKEESSLLTRCQWAVLYKYTLDYDTERREGRGEPILST